MQAGNQSFTVEQIRTDLNALTGSQSASSETDYVRTSTTANDNAIHGAHALNWPTTLAAGPEGLTINGTSPPGATLEADLLAAGNPLAKTLSDEDRVFDDLRMAIRTPSGRKIVDDIEVGDGNPVTERVRSRWADRSAANGLSALRRLWRLASMGGVIETRANDLLW